MFSLQFFMHVPRNFKGHLSTYIWFKKLLSILWVLYLEWKNFQIWYNKCSCNKLTWSNVSQKKDGKNQTIQVRLRFNCKNKDFLHCISFKTVLFPFEMLSSLFFLQTLKTLVVWTRKIDKSNIRNYCSLWKSLLVKVHNLFTS